MAAPITPFATARESPKTAGDADCSARRTFDQRGIKFIRAIQIGWRDDCHYKERVVEHLQTASQQMRPLRDRIWLVQN
jgi:hypothetical protein